MENDTATFQATNFKKNPSELWEDYSDSVFEERHLSKEDKEIRTSSTLFTAANVTKMYVGIAFISVSRSISLAGIYTAALGFCYVLLVNIYCVWILLKARNRFKHSKIIDICDLTAKLYGEDKRKYMTFLLVSTNILFLMCYVVFFGSQLDQLMCSSFKLTACGHPHLYAVACTTFLLPIIFQKELRNIGFFSLVVLAFTMAAIVMILYICIQVIRKPLAVIDAEYQLKLTKYDRMYVKWDLSMLPMFCSAMMNIFEGN